MGGSLTLLRFASRFQEKPLATRRSGFYGTLERYVFSNPFISIEAIP